jgi:hypothetical protein
MGLVFRHPTDWGALRTSDGVILCPASMEYDCPGLVESCFVMVEASLDVSGIEDASIWKSMDELVRAQAPFLERQGPIRQARCHRGKGAVASWSGKGPSGVLASSRVYVSLLEDTMAALVAIGSTSRMEQLTATLEEIFASFSHEACANDPQLVGIWLEDLDRGDHELRIQSPEGIEFLRDGTFIRPGTQAPAGRKSKAARPVADGRWLVRDGVLMLNYSDGHYTRFNYRFESAAEGMQLLLTDTQGHLHHWKPVAAD